MHMFITLIANVIFRAEYGTLIFYYYMRKCSVTLHIIGTFWIKGRIVYVFTTSRIRFCLHSKSQNLCIPLITE